MAHGNGVSFGRDGKPAALKSLLFVLFFGPIGFFMGGAVASTLGTSVVVGQVATAVVPTVLVALLGYVFGGRGTLVFGDEGVQFGDRSVPYGDVAVAVREEHLSNRLFGTATFELVVLGGQNMTVRYVQQPEEVARLLADRLTPPAEQQAAAPETTDADGRELLEERWRFWDYWRADEPLPETAVVDLSECKRVMDVSAVDLDRIDGVDMSDAAGLSDIEKSDVTASSQTHNP